MPKGVSKLANKILDFIGEDVLVRPRIVTVTDGERDITFGDQYVLRGQVSQITGDAELMDMFGIRTTADYLMTVSSSSTISPNDIVFYGSVWLEVKEVLPRKTGNKVDYIDCLLQRRE